MRRREFLQGAAVATLAAPAVRAASTSPNDRISRCVMGLRGRGGKLLSTSFVDDDQANRFLTRPQYRSPWVLPVLSEFS